MLDNSVWVCAAGAREEALLRYEVLYAIEESRYEKFYPSFYYIFLLSREKNWNIQGMRKSKKKLEEGKLDTFLNSKLIQVQLSYWLTDLLWAWPERVYAFQSLWLSSLCYCFSLVWDNLVPSVWKHQPVSACS